MPIHFLCPHCGAATDVAEKFAGEIGPCAHCGRPITIPSPGGVTSTPARTTMTTTVIAILTGVLAFALLGAAMWAMVLLPTAKTDREAARRMQCANNLRQIALAMSSSTSRQRLLPARLHRRQARQAHAQLAGVVAALLGSEGLGRSVPFRRAVEQPQQPLRHRFGDRFVSVSQPARRQRADRPTT